MIFDTHAHYDDEAFDPDRGEVLKGLAAAGVGRVVNAAASPESLRRIDALTKQWDFLYGSAGLHPDEVGKLTEEVVDEIRELLIRNPKIVAVGEIGLDYHWDVEPHEVQIRCFKEQIGIALDAGKPIIVHSRTAAADTMTVVSEIYGNGRGREAKQKGVIHAYPGSLEQAKCYTEMGFYLGIGGVLTYQTSKKLKKVVAGIPLERLLLETDCPYLTPEPFRGERNTSAYLREVVRAIAEIKGVTEAEVEDRTFENAVTLFGIA